MNDNSDVLHEITKKAFTNFEQQEMALNTSSSICEALTKMETVEHPKFLPSLRTDRDRSKPIWIKIKANWCRQNGKYVLHPAFFKVRQEQESKAQHVFKQPDKPLSTNSQNPQFQAPTLQSQINTQRQREQVLTPSQQQYETLVRHSLQKPETQRQPSQFPAQMQDLGQTPKPNKQLFTKSNL